MVMAYRGVSLPTITVAQTVYDAEHRIYGNWPYAVQGAYSYSVPGYLRRFSDWREVERAIAGDQPLVISIRVKPGQLSAAPQAATAGHLVVLTGFDREGNVEINDPNYSVPHSGRRLYPRQDLEQVWMRNSAGTAYVLLPRE
jgi:hypothetical protein